MTGFPLFSVPPITLERIVTKMQARSYTRLQQTCPYMKEFVKSSRNIIVDSNIEVYVVWGDSEIILTSAMYDRRDVGPSHVSHVPIDIDGLYGIRCNRLWIEPEVFNHFEKLCGILKDHRISCKRLDFMYVDSSLPTKKHCDDLYRFLKPTQTSMDSRESNRMEALINKKSLKKVELFVSYEDAISALELVAPHVSKVLIEVAGRKNISKHIAIDEHFNMLKEVIEHLRIARRRKNSIEFTLSCGKILPPVKQQLQREEMHRYHPNPWPSEDKDRKKVHFVHCAPGRGRPSILILMNRSYARVSW